MMESIKDILRHQQTLDWVPKDKDGIIDWKNPETHRLVQIAFRITRSEIGDLQRERENLCRDLYRAELAYSRVMHLEERQQDEDSE